MDTLYLYAAAMGFVMAAPFGAIGAACALAAMQHRLKAALLLAAGVLVGDAILITIVNVALTSVPNLSWEEVKSWTWLWWPMVTLLAVYGVLLLFTAPGKISKAVLRPARPFWQGVGWTLIANPKNWLGTFGAYAGWQVAGLFTSQAQQALVGVSAWLGGVAAWVVWITLCWHAQRYQVRADAVAQKLVGGLCLFTAFSAAYTLSVG